MNINDPGHKVREANRADSLVDPLGSEEELRSLAEDIVKYCPSLTQLLLAMGSQSKDEDPLQGLN
ncbi:MAG: hypothetical protein AAF191_05070 [Verrucomicrobiota bacterium]